MDQRLREFGHNWLFFCRVRSAILYSPPLFEKASVALAGAGAWRGFDWWFSREEGNGEFFMLRCLCIIGEGLVRSEVPGSGFSSRFTSSVAQSLVRSCPGWSLEARGPVRAPRAQAALSLCARKSEGSRGTWSSQEKIKLGVTASEFLLLVSCKQLCDCHGVRSSNSPVPCCLPRTAWRGPPLCKAHLRAACFREKTLFLAADPWKNAGKRGSRCAGCEGPG